MADGGPSWFDFLLPWRRRVPLTERTERLLALLFASEDDRTVAQRRLETECARNLPFCGAAGATELERIRFAVLKLGAGDLAATDRAIRIAKADWRDLLMDAGFGDAEDAHETWYAETTRS